MRREGDTFRRLKSTGVFMPLSRMRGGKRPETLISGTFSSKCTFNVKQMPVFRERLKTSRYSP